MSVLETRFLAEHNHVNQLIKVSNLILYEKNVVVDIIVGVY